MYCPAEEGVGMHWSEVEYMEAEDECLEKAGISPLPSPIHWSTYVA